VQQPEQPAEEMRQMKDELLKSLSAEVLTKELMENKEERDRSLRKSLVGLTSEQIRKIEKNRRKTKKQNEKRKFKYQALQNNRYIYVHGLPEDITAATLDEFFSRAGPMKKDPFTNAKKIKIYKSEDNKCKGDAILAYLREESVEIALEMLDNREIQPGHKIKIERAKFTYKKDQPSNPKKKIDKLTKLKMQQEQKLHFGWEEDDQLEGLKIIIMKFMFTQEEAGQSPADFFTFLERDICEECEASIGPISRIKIFELHPDGVVQIKFQETLDAQRCIESMHGRKYAGRNIEVAYWDGETDFTKVSETHEEKQQRLHEFGSFLEGRQAENA